MPRGVDAAVGNVPFGDIRLHDPLHNGGNHSIHNHFIIKTLAMTRPGGLVAVLTSRYTLDDTNPAARREMQAVGDLVGAVRLPSGAHQRCAGTEVVTDVLVFRRRTDGQEPAEFDWELTTPVDVDGIDVRINGYFELHPAQVLGRIGLDHGMYGADTLVVRTDDPARTPEALQHALSAVVKRGQEPPVELLRRRPGVRCRSPRAISAPPCTDSPTSSRRTSCGPAPLADSAQTRDG